MLPPDVTRRFQDRAEAFQIPNVVTDQPDRIDRMPVAATLSR